MVRFDVPQKRNQLRLFLKGQPLQKVSKCSCIGGPHRQR